MSGKASSANSYSLIGCSLPVAPDLLCLHAANPQRYPFLLESAAGGTEQGRYDLLFGFPGETLQLGGEQASVANNFLDAFDSWFADESVDAVESTLPFKGGWFLYLSYELAAEVEPSLKLPDDPQAPVAFATRVPLAIVVDKETGQATVVAEPGAAEFIDGVLADIAAADELPQPTAFEGSVAEEESDHFLEAVQRAKQYIAEGDIFQANLSRLWSAEQPCKQAPWELYAQLRAANPAPFAGLAVKGDFAVISSSPERLIACDGERVDARPIAGTTPRSDGEELSDEQLQAFVGNPKERAEHVMLIDLERNDLGRICEGGSVEVSEFMVVETYSHVHHIVSNVVGKKRADVTPGQMIKAVFPGGTITGCAKVRCMEIIAELEGRPRGAYTGSMGYINRDGSGDLNILIRTMTLHSERLTLAAGSGIVADSEPQSELNETRAKAKGLLLSLQSGDGA